MWKTSLALLLVACSAPVSAGSLGVATCASGTCHGSARPAEKGDIQGNEYVTWSRFDPHAGAYRTLSDERSAAMARRLGIGAAGESPECLACHADNPPVAERGPKFQLDDGIGCEACHGGATRWLASHDDFPRVDHAANVANGMTDLADPRVRAATCSGCHVGDGNRFASHRLMAAGHPRLAFELDTFTELWRTSGGREHYVRDADYAARKPVAPATQAWAAGLVAAARAQAGLITQRYGSNGALPDFALFNCYSCHRAMRLKDWQDKGRDSDPGRLRFDGGVLTVLQAALAGRPRLGASLDRDVAAFQAAAGADVATVKRTAAALDTTLAGIERALAASPLTAAECGQALDALARGAGRGDFPDYAGAEQAAMGLAVLVSETGERSRQQKQVEELFRALENDERYDPTRFARLLTGALPGASH